MIDTAGGSTSAPDGEAAIPASPSPNIVHLACRCPGHVHEYDTVTLDTSVSNPMGMAIAEAMDQNRGDGLVMGSAIAMVYLRYGIRGWSFTDRLKDEHGAFQSVPVWITTPIPLAMLERWLPFANGGYTVAQAANVLFAEEAFRPFQPTPQTRSPDGPEENSTSAPTDSGLTPPTPLRPSSRTRSGAGKRSGGRGR